jgi:hypothetical protein
LRADIDYGFREAKTTSGRVGVKVWIYKGDILPYKVSIEDKITREAAMAVGETSGQGGPRRLITAGGGRRRADAFPADEDGAVEGVEEEIVDTLEAEVTEVVAPEAVIAEAVVTNAVTTPEAPAVEGEEETETPPADLLPSPTEPDDLERQLTQDEEMERQNRHQHHEAPHFRKESD